MHKLNVQGSSIQPSIQLSEYWEWLQNHIVDLFFFFFMFLSCIFLRTLFGEIPFNILTIKSLLLLKIILTRELPALYRNGFGPGVTFLANNKSIQSIKYESGLNQSNNRIWEMT